MMDEDSAQIGGRRFLEVPIITKEDDKVKSKSGVSVPNGFLAAMVVFIFIAGIATMLITGHNIGKLQSMKQGTPETINTTSGNSLEGINSRAASPNAFEDKSNLPGDYRLVSVLNEDISKGSLVLVNYNHESKIDGENLVNLYESVTDYVGVKEDDMLLNSVVIEPIKNMFGDFKKATGGNSRIIISSSYRSKSDQEDIYADSVEQTGKKSTAYYVAVPGFSEHQTGYCFDTAAINNDGEMVELDGEGDSAWFAKNCQNYGFILRYPDDKTNITGIGYESWHFRYLGKPHAIFVMKNKLCFEEYITGISRYTFDKGGLLIEDGSKGKWVVYYVPKLSAFNNTDIPVPVDSAKCPYTVSGDNMEGFVVTVDVSKDPSNSLLQKAASQWNFDSSELKIKDFMDYDPLTDTDDDEEDSDSDKIRSNQDRHWEDDSFWENESNGTDIEYVDSYDEYNESYVLSDVYAYNEEEYYEE